MLNYNIRISGIKDGNHEYFFNINEKFFESFVESELINCVVKVNCNLFKDGNKLKLEYLMIFSFLIGLFKRKISFL